MRILQLHNDLDELETKIVDKLGEINNLFFVNAHQVLSSLISSSMSDSNAILSILRKEISEMKNKLLADNFITSNKDSNVSVLKPIGPLHLKLKPLSELKEYSNLNYEQNERIELACHLEKKRKTDTESDSNTQNEQKTICMSSCSSVHEDDNISESLPYQNKLKFKLKKLKSKKAGLGHYFHGRYGIANVEKELDTINTSSITSNQVAVENETEKSKQPNKCRSCDFKFKNKKPEIIQKHIDGHHTQPFHCDVCLFVGRSKEHLVEHTVSTTHSELKFKCNYHECNYAYKKACQLVKHIEGEHIKTKKLKCKVCQKVFEKKHIYRNHYCPEL